MATLTTIPTPTGHEDVVRALLTFGNVRPANLRGTDRGVTLTGDVVFDGDSALMFNGFSHVQAGRGQLRARRSGGNGFVAWRALAAGNLRAEWRIAQNNNAVIVCTTVGTVQDGRWDLRATGLVAAASGGTMAVLVSRPVPAAVEVLVSGTATRGTPSAAGIIRDELPGAVTIAGVARRGAPSVAGIIRDELPGDITVAGVARRGMPSVAGIIRDEAPGAVTVAGVARRGVPSAAGIIRDEATDSTTVAGVARRGVPVATGIIGADDPGPITVGGTATRGTPRAVGIIRDEAIDAATVSGVARRGVPAAAGIIRDEALDAITVSGVARRGVPTVAGIITEAAPIVVPPGVVPTPVRRVVTSTAAPAATHLTKARRVTTIVRV